jgi:hypothetical protein
MSREAESGLITEDIDRKGVMEIRAVNWKQKKTPDDMSGIPVGR